MRFFISKLLASSASGVMNRVCHVCTTNDKDKKRINGFTCDVCRPRKRMSLDKMQTRFVWQMYKLL